MFLFQLDSVGVFTGTLLGAEGEREQVLPSVPSSLGLVQIKWILDMSSTGKNIRRMNLTSFTKPPIPGRGLQAARKQKNFPEKWGTIGQVAYCILCHFF